MTNFLEILASATDIKINTTSCLQPFIEITTPTGKFTIANTDLDGSTMTIAIQPENYTDMPYQI